MKAAEESCELTADIDGVAEGSGNLRIELDHEVVLLGKVHVAASDHIGDPKSEVLTNEGVDNVDDPLPRQPRDVTFVREVGDNFLVLASLLENVIDG